VGPVPDPHLVVHHRRLIPVPGPGYPAAGMVTVTVFDRADSTPLVSTAVTA
jgi:hypothetical protein